VAEDSTGAGLVCARCGEAHTIIACPHVKAVEFTDGFYEGEDQPRITRIEFFAPADYGPAPAPGENPPPGYATLGGTKWGETQK
jgi:hypothetical protein